MDPDGARVDLLGPLLWNHLSSEPIGKLVEIIEQMPKRLRTLEAIVNNPLGRDVAQLIEFGAVRRMSHGFLPGDEEGDVEELLDKDGEFVGYHVRSYEMLERSPVSVASNRGAEIDAVRTVFGRAKLAHPLVKGWAQRLYEARPPIVRGANLEGGEDEEQEQDEPRPLVDDEASGGRNAVPPARPVDTQKAAEPEHPADSAPESRPYPNEHACRLKPPGDYSTCRRTTRKHDGKEYSVITCRRKDDPDKWEEQGFRYGTDAWTAAAARSHCEDHDGKFEAASRADAEPQEKSGRAISKANEARLRDASEDLGEQLGMDIPRAAKALARSAKSNVDAVLDAVADDGGAGDAAKTQGKGEGGARRGLLWALRRIGGAVRR